MRIFCLLCLLAMAIQANAQTYTDRKTAPPKAVKALDKALGLSRGGQSDKALASVNKAISVSPTFIDAWLLKANLFLDQKNWAEAEKALEMAAQLHAEYHPNTYKWLAETEWEQDKFAECAMHARQFLSSPSANKASTDKSKYALLRLAENAEFAAVAVKNPVPFQPIGLSDSINTPDPEYLPSLTAEGKYLLFTRRDQNRDENYYLSERKDSVWSKAIPVEALNTQNLEGAASLSPDGIFFVFSSEDREEMKGEGNFDIWYATAKGPGQYAGTKRFGKNVNSTAWDAQPCLAANGNELYFASKRPGSAGGMDLWMCKREGSGFGPATPLTSLNTPGDEQVPFVHPDGQTIYFTSNGLPGMGDADIYYARRQADGSWGKPINLGYPINTKADEGAMTVTLDGRTAYYAARSASSVTKHDLFQFSLPESARPAPVTYVRGTVLDKATKQRLSGVEITLTDLETKETTVLSQGGGSFLVCLPAGKNYGLYAKKQGYLFYSGNYNFSLGANVTAPELVEVLLTPIPASEGGGVSAAPPVGTVVVLNNLFFDSGLATLQPDSDTELESLVSLLRSNAKLRIRINGHTDNVGNTHSNQALSEARAKAVFDQLVKRGIEANRLEYKGYGETKPVASNDTESGRAKNRRTEMEVF